MAENNRYETYSHLDQLSTEQLEELLRADLHSPDQSKEEVIFHILEVLEQREKENPTDRLPDAQQAWAEFQQYYAIPEGEGQTLYPAAPQQEEPTPRAKIRRPRKWILIAAALIALFGGMFTAQAVGFNLFGAIGRWSDESFHFSLPNTLEKKDISDLLEAAISCDLPSILIPTWYPDGFEPSEPQAEKIENYLDYITCLYVNDKDGESYAVEIERYYHLRDTQALTFEKDDSEVVPYRSKDKTFYITSNLNTITAAWSDGSLVVTIAGQLELNEMKLILDSIGN